MDKISQLMDGEMGCGESRTQIKRLESDARLLDGWETYHLIRDALRREGALSPDFCHKVRARLAQEPVVIAPRARLAQHVARYTLPIAAGVAGVTLAAWLALSLQEAGPPQGQIVARLPAGRQATPAGKPGALPASAGVKDYLMAHQEFSPSTAMQGVASYVRTVSSDELNGR
jgi:sigma-E factor negative regulatory protein RseA